MKYLFAFLSLFFVISGKAQYYNDVLSYNNNAYATNGYKIKTNIPFTNRFAMPTIWIEGYDFTIPGYTLNLTISSYVLGDTLTRTTVSSAGGSAPPIKIGNENGKMSIFLDYKNGYYVRFHVRAFAQGMSETAAMFTGWSVVDSALIPEATAVRDIPYRNAFAGTVNLPDSVFPQQMVNSVSVHSRPRHHWTSARW